MYKNDLLRLKHDTHCFQIEHSTTMTTESLHKADIIREIDSFHIGNK